jgi:hypothetical protein
VQRWRASRVFDQDRVEARQSARRDLRWWLAASFILALILGIDAAYARVNADTLPLPPLTFDLIAAGFVGAAAGITTRLAMQSWPKLVRLALAATTVLVWSIVAEAAHAVWMGRPAFDPTALEGGWTLLGLLGVGFLGSSAGVLILSPIREKVRLAWIWNAEEQVATATVVKARTRWGLLISLILATSLGLGAAFLRVGAEQLGIPIPPAALAFTGAALMGLISGLVTRWALRGWGDFIRLTLVLLALVSWIALAEAAYPAWSNRDPAHHLTLIDPWFLVSQLVIGSLGAVVGGWPRRRIRPVAVGTVLRYDRSMAAPTQIVVPTPPPREEIPPEPRPSLPRTGLNWPSLPNMNIPRLSQIELPNLSRWRLPDLSRYGLPDLSQLLPTRPRQSDLVRIVAREEDRCPYCLDLIERRDPRGVVRCRTCGTPHHSDCWEEGGGACQVPHLVA